MGRADLQLFLLVGAITLSAVALISLAVPDLPSPKGVPGHPLLMLALVVAGFAAAELAVVYLPIGRNAYSVTLNEIPLVVGLFLLPPSHYVLARLLGAVLPLAWRNRRSLHKLAFNVAHYALEAAAVVLVWRLVLGDAGQLSPWGWVAIGVAIVSTDLLGTVLISLAIAVTTGTRPRFAINLLVLGPLLPMVNASLGLVLVYVLSVDWRAIWTVGVVLAVLFSAQRAHHSLRQRTESLEQLSRFTGEIGGRTDVESAASTAVVWIAQALGAETVELTLNAAFAGRARHWEGGIDGSVRELSGSSKAGALAAWTAAGPVLARRGSRDAILGRALRVAGLRDAVAMPLRGDDGVVGTLVVGDRLGDVETFGPANLRELTALGNHLSVALRNARRADLITEQVAEQLRQSMHDSLTGLPNRRHLEELLARRLAAGEDVGVVLLNLDRFKEINETLGHPAGDSLLQKVAKRMASTVPQRGVLARVGGDEFAVLLPQAAPAVADSVVTLLRQSLSGPFELDELHVTVSAAFGTAFADRGSDVIDVLRRADIAMSAAKSRHTAVEAYRPELDASSRERLTVLTDLKQAITDGSLVVHVQPKVSLRDGAVVGVEALARWLHPERGLIPPDEFIPVAEHSGLITPLTMSVLRQSLLACEAWRKAGQSLGIAVNISPRSLLDPDFVDQVARALAAVEVPASALTLEITESSLMADPERAIEALGRLRALGVRLSIDDLGTGYSSLAYLQRLPVHEIKVDRSFLRRADLDAHDESVAIIGAIIDLGHRLGREVVAEGVEDEASWRLLQTLGCDTAQGFWMSRPMPAEDLLGWLAAWQSRPLAAVRSAPLALA